MDSNSKPRVFLPATLAVQQASSYPHDSPLSTSSAGSFLIRAPLTVDDDDSVSGSGSGYGYESDSGRIAVYSRDDGRGSSGGSSDNERFVSGGEEFETASERQFVVDTDEEILDRNDFLNNSRNSVPIVMNPDEELSQDSSFDDEESGVGVDEFEGSEVDSGVLNSMKLENNMVVPMARLSIDDDDLIGVDEEGTESEDEEGGFSGTVEVHSGVNIERVDSVPRVKVTESEGEDESSSSSGQLSPVVFLVQDKVELNGRDGTSEYRAKKGDGVDIEESTNCQYSECSSLDARENVFLDAVGDKGNAESDVLPEIDMGAYLFDPLAVISTKAEDGVFQGKEIQTQDSDSEVNQTMHNEDFLVVNEGERSEYTNSSSVSEECVNQEGRRSGMLSDGDVEELIFGSSKDVAVNEYGERLPLNDQKQAMDGQIFMESDDEMDTEGDGEENELFDSAALAALLKAATGAESDADGLTITSSDGSKVFTLRSPTNSFSFSSIRPAPAPNVEVSPDLSEEEKRRCEKIQHLRVKFLRLVQRLGHSAEDPIVEQMLYRLALALGRHSDQTFSLESAKGLAVQHEAEEDNSIDFSLNILVLGKSGVGKSATINSIFNKETTMINAFEPATTAVKMIAGKVHGVDIRILDTPGLKPSAKEQIVNRRLLASVKKWVKKFPPDIVLYVDRLDTHARDFSDLPLLQSITTSLGSSIWQNAILSLTHAGSDPPDGPSGSPLNYEVFVAQRAHVIRQSISRAVGDLHMMNQSMMQPVSLVENHLSSEKNRAGESMLPNGQAWRPQMLLLCYSLKIISEVKAVTLSEGSFNHKKLFGFRRRSAPLSYLLSSLLQSRSHPKLSADQGGDDLDLDIELANISDSEEDDEDEYSQLPPFKPLKKFQVANLSPEQRKAYFEEYDYRIKLLQKKQWKEEVERLKELKKKGNTTDDYKREDADQDDETPSTLPVPLPDLVLPPSFDGDNPVYRYRFLEPTSQVVVRPVLDSHGWDHDCGYDGVSVETSLAIASQFPSAFAVQITKDKKEFNIHFNSSVAAKYKESGSTMAGLDVQTVGRQQLAYILRGEAEFRNFKSNKTSAGVSVTFLGENLATGLKVEDKLAVGKRWVLSGNAGAMRSQGDTAYGGTLEVRLKDKDFPIEQDQSSLSLSMLNWRGDSTLMANLESQLSIGRGSKMAVRVGLNNKRSGQITVKLSNSEQLQLALFGILPVAMSIFRRIYPGASEKNSAY